MHARSSLAEVYFMLGDLPKAETLFQEAMSIERERHPNPPFPIFAGPVPLWILPHRD